MAGKITVSTINDSSGVLATQNGMTGIPKAWVNFAGATGTRNGSFNVSSVTVNSAGNYSVAFTTALPDANYCPMASSAYYDNTTTGGISFGGTSLTTSGFTLRMFLGNSGVSPSVNIYLTIVGN